MKREKTAAWLKVMRTKLGMTQIQLAEALGVSPRTVPYWEQRGLPIKGMTQNTVTEAIERMLKENKESGKYKLVGSRIMKTQTRKAEKECQPKNALIAETDPG